MAEQTNGSIDIDAPPKAVMAVIADFESYPEWSDVRSAEIRERDRQGRGKEVHYELSAMGFHADYTLAYRYAAGNKGCSWTLVEGNNVKDVTGSYELEPVDAGTRVTYRLTVEPGIPLPGLVKRQAEKKIVRTALDGLKRRVESL